MNHEARRLAIGWLLKQLEMGIARFRDAEVQAELVKEKITYQRELRALDEPKQTALFSDPAAEPTTVEAAH